MFSGREGVLEKRKESLSTLPRKEKRLSRKEKKEAAFFGEGTSRTERRRLRKKGKTRPCSFVGRRKRGEEAV